MIEPVEKDVSIQRQCELIGLASSSYYYRFQPVSEEDHALMRRIDVVFTAHPFYGSRKITRILREEGLCVNRKHVQRLMRMMGISAIYPKKNLSRPNVDHRKFPYLLRGLTIARPNQVWCADITYIRLTSGWAYLVAVMDWHSRCVLSWRLSNSMGTNFCIEALEEALIRYGKPEIFNTDQGSQFTSEEFLGVLEKHEIRISMDGKGRALDNVFIERLWRSLKYEEVYTKDYQSMTEARRGIADWFSFYNTERPHAGLCYKTPFKVYQNVA